VGKDEKNLLPAVIAKLSSGVPCVEKLCPFNLVAWLFKVRPEKVKQEPWAQILAGTILSLRSIDE
jgi:hypothetical protein